jgi:hypothetical protein
LSAVHTVRTDPSVHEVQLVLSAYPFHSCSRREQELVAQLQSEKQKALIESVIEQKMMLLPTSPAFSSIATIAQLLVHSAS